MNTKNYINTDSMANSTNSLNSKINKINELFTKINTEMQSAQDRQIWLGNTSDAIFTKYNDLKSNYDAITTSMNSVVEFMNLVVNSYNEWEEKMEELAENGDLDMNNSKK